jgi:PAT family beta-lactamase induction signal transducer AmpG
MLSGFIQEYLGYGNFFIWVFIATIQDWYCRDTWYSKFGKKSKQK